MPNLGCWWFIVGLAGFVLLIWTIGWLAQAWEERRRPGGERTHRRGFPVEPQNGEPDAHPGRGGSRGD